MSQATNKISLLHEQLFQILMDYRKSYPTFTFPIRAMDDSGGRFRRGYWFQGTEDYIFMGLYKRGDSANKTKTVGLVLTLKDQELSRAYVEVVYSGQENRPRAPLYGRILKEFGIEQKADKVRYSLDLKLSSDLKSFITEFLDTYKPKLDAVLKAEGEWDNFVLSEVDFQKALEKKASIVAKGPKPANPIPDSEAPDDEEELVIADDRIYNRIYYGPPGTGKTYKLRKDLFPLFAEKESTKEEALEERSKAFIAEASWWEVVAAVVVQIGTPKVSVDEIQKHPLFRQKAALSNNNNQRSTIWSSLQTHTEPGSKTVSYEARREPYIFDKTDNSLWYLVPNWKERAEDLWERIDALTTKTDLRQEICRYEFVTFHQSYGYEEFVEGIRPKLIGGQTSYDVVDGVFKRIAIKAKLDPDHRYALFIDEINRGNISKVFGELITLIEPDKRTGYDYDGNPLREDQGLQVRLPYSGQLFGVPRNLAIIGTMNTADRSIALLDIALRRRFDFEELVPLPEILKGKDGRGNLVLDDDSEINLPAMLSALNQRIEILLGRDLMIGHAFFTDVKDFKRLQLVFAGKVLPLLQEYFYGQWDKIQMVLGDHPDQRGADKNPERLFVQETYQSPTKILGMDWDEGEGTSSYRVNPNLSLGLMSPDAFRKIYQ